MRTPFDEHEDGCPTKLAAEGAAAIECEHGYDCCPICDRCTCDDEPSEATR